ncbi:MAG: peptidoglycan DD-metalloendopeptidase family protein [Mariprofundaceae bacterium]|nr:peptidoglycan DD-metalloendopeptidase family protein [Mariprofundaceae bacterium]
MNKILYVLLLVMLSLFVCEKNVIARDIQHDIHTVKQERAHLRQIRKHLDAKLGQLGRQMHDLDQELLSARTSLKHANRKWLKSKRKVASLSKQQKKLQLTIQKIERHMQAEANMAWKRDHREPSWLDILVGGDVTQIPHRQSMMRFVLEGQAKERRTWETSLHDLNVVEQALRVEYDRLSALKSQKLAAKKKIEVRWKAKHQSMKRLKHDVALKKKREHALKVQEKALLQMLDGLKDALLHSDKVAKQTSVRQKKGHLPWPMRGALVLHFGDYVAYLHRQSQGVQIKPSHQNEQGLQVHAMHAGQVRYADWFGGFGLMLVVEYGHGILAVYAHNDALHKQVGDWVDAGDVLADAGSTGWVDKTRLYFEIRDHGKAVNPKKWCR